ncbi:Protein kinase-like domain [Phytophthora cactorum]|nr:Protein kinase-like domain [Phytophthora cactorum]
MIVRLDSRLGKGGGAHKEKKGEEQAPPHLPPCAWSSSPRVGSSPALLRTRLRLSSVACCTSIMVEDKKRKPSRDFPAHAQVPVGKVHPKGSPPNRPMPRTGSVMSVDSVSSVLSVDDSFQFTGDGEEDEEDVTKLPKDQRPAQPADEREYFERMWAENFKNSEAQVNSTTGYLPVGAAGRLNRIKGFSFARDQVSHKLYAVFRLEIECIVSEKQWTIYRRFHDFKQLAHQLKNESVRVSAVPTRTLMRSLDPNFLRKRQLELDRWLREVLMLISLENCKVDTTDTTNAAETAASTRVTSEQKTDSESMSYEVEEGGGSSRGRRIRVGSADQEPMGDGREAPFNASTVAEQRRSVILQDVDDEEDDYDEHSSRRGSNKVSLKQFDVLRGDLFFHLSRCGCFPEAMAKFYAAEIVLALIHLHEQGIVYRDLKPENIMLDVDGHVKLADFGLAKEGITSELNGTYTMCGTPEYLPPEILNRVGHGTAVDWWNLGMVLYEMLTGRPPWYTQDRQELFNRLRGAELEFPQGLTPEAMNLIEGLLMRDPAKRLGAIDVRAAVVSAVSCWSQCRDKRAARKSGNDEASGRDPADNVTAAAEAAGIGAGMPNGIAGSTGTSISSSQRNSTLRNLSYTFAGFTYDGTNPSIARSGSFAQSSRSSYMNDE